MSVAQTRICIGFEDCSRRLSQGHASRLPMARTQLGPWRSMQNPGPGGMQDSSPGSCRIGVLGTRVCRDAWGADFAVFAWLFPGWWGLGTVFIGTIYRDEGRGGVAGQPTIAMIISNHLTARLHRWEAAKAAKSYRVSPPRFLFRGARSLVAQGLGRANRQRPANRPPARHESRQRHE